MPSNNHPNRNGRSRMSRPSYEKLARELRHYADLIEANCARETPQQKRTLTQAMSNLRHCTDSADARHNGRPKTAARELFEAHLEIAKLKGEYDDSADDRE